MDDDEDTLSVADIININSNKNKYDNKAIRFIDCNTHYELIFMDEFTTPSKFNTIITDILLDLKQADKNKELHIFINSYGGAITTLTALLQQIKEFEYIVTIAMGDADSAGFLLWSMGNERYCSTFSALMHHNISISNIEGKASEVASYGSYISDHYNILIETTGIDKILTKEELERGKHTEIWLLGKDLIKRGAAKDYVEYKNRISIPVSVVADFGNIILKKNIITNKFEVFIKGKDSKEFTYAEVKNLCNKEKLYEKDFFILKGTSKSKSKSK